MSISKHRPWLFGMALVTATFLVAPVTAGEIDPYLPPDTEVVVSLNVKQFLTSGLAKKLGIDKAKEALKDLDHAGDVLKELGFDPFTDLDKMITAGPGSSDPDKGLIILYGKFDLAKFKTLAERAIKDHPDIVKAGKSGDKDVYEVNIPGQDGALFVTFVDKNTILASPGKAYLGDSLKKIGGKEKPALMSKAFQTILEKQDEKQIVSIAALGSALLKSDLKDTPAKVYLEKVEAFDGGIKVGDDIKVDFQIGAKNDDDAKELAEQLTKGIESGLTIVGLVAGGEKRLDVVVDLLKSMKTSSTGKKVTLKGGLDAAQIDKILKKDL